MTSQPGRQTNKHSRSKSNQATKFGQLIDYNMRNIFLKKLYTNMLDKLFLDPFLKNQN